MPTVRGNVWEDPLCRAFLDSILGGAVGDALIFADYLEEARYEPGYYLGDYEWMRLSVMREDAIRLLEPPATELRLGEKYNHLAGPIQRMATCPLLDVERTVVLVRGPALLYEIGMVWHLSSVIPYMVEGKLPDCWSSCVEVKLVLWKLGGQVTATTYHLSWRGSYRHSFLPDHEVRLYENQLAILSVGGPTDKKKPLGEAQGWICYARK